MLLRSGADPSIPNSNGILAGELTVDKDIRALLSRDPSQTLHTTVSAMNKARHDLKIFAEATGTGTATGLAEKNTTDYIDNIGFDRMTIRASGNREVSTSSKLRKESASSISPYDNSTLNTQHNHDTNDMNNYTNEIEDAEIENDLRQAVLKAATDTAVATKNIEGADGRRKVAHLCQDKKNVTRNEGTLRKVTTTINLQQIIFLSLIVRIS